MTPRPHAAIIKAWADGATIQYQVDSTRQWITCETPAFSPTGVYRIKPSTIGFRVALFYSPGPNKHYVATVASKQREAEINDAEDNGLGSGFCRWLTDWTEVEL